jgi:hypothetical protein
MSVDHVTRLGQSAQVTGSPRHVTVQSDLGGAPKETGQEGLTRTATSPCLSHRSRRRHHPFTSAASGLYQGRYLAISAIERDESAGVEYEAHSGRAGTPLGLVLQHAIRLSKFGVGQRAELLLPRTHCLP